MKKRLFILTFLVIIASILGVDTRGLIEESDFLNSSEDTSVLNATSEEVLVTKVIDGDTIKIETGETVRYIGVDTPEIHHPQKEIECFGEEAAMFNKDLVEGKLVRLEKDVSERDRYGRLLRYVYIGDTFVNQELALNGFAYSVTYPPDVKYQKKLFEAQQQAELDFIGLWRECPQSN